MIKRRLNSKLEYLLATTPAVVLIGPRQVGKTTLAHALSARASVYLDLESEVDRAKLAEPTRYFAEHEDELVILDEIQRVPEVFQSIRGVIDEGRRKGKGNGRFLFLGSASLDLLRQAGESLAGRISILELSPFDVLEVDDNPDTLWVRGGFPDSFLAGDDAQSMQWRRDFIRTYLERDIPLMGPRIPAETLRRFWTMLAHTSGGLLNAAALARGLDTSGTTIASYLDLMVDLLLVRRLQPWVRNTGKRLVKSPKVYLRDSGIMHTLLGIENKESLLSHPSLGASWEGFVIENILRMAPDAQASFYRAATGEEVDLVLEVKGETWAIEVKRSLAPKVGKGFHKACEHIKPDRKFIVYSGNDQFSAGDGVEVIGLEGIARLLER